ncbi:putative U4/U6 small nuclear ribonucleo protein Prp4 [Naematelia encephala]|uniref:Putative U4/U6 small nuclear ribonucleo protein Prp4 n=1 Tax=Naematelia encephala TaxID=71784 RepID=A0A1Y2AS78_9TREE|nr:putative U4/U6 small nuclear ribonucleo protein Prp4 [Naematelia encephala]
MDLDDLTIDNTYELGGSDDDREREQNAELLEQLERKKRLRRMAVPTDDAKVRQRLRAYGEPITLFGEGPGDRRDRLKYVQEQIESAKGTGGMNVDYDDSESSDEEEEGEFYTEGSNDLLAARRNLARYSLGRAKLRVARQRVEVGLPLSRIVNARKELFNEMKTFTNLGSQFGDDRPLSTIRFSPNSQYLLTTSWTGDAKLWDLPNLNAIGTKRGHTERVGGAAWHPHATVGMSEEGVNIATGGGEGSVKLWSLTGEKPLATLLGHTNRVGRVAFHPSGAFLGSSSFDGTWRLWDVEKQTELLVQEGHSKEVFALAFQDDGALVASGGFDAIGRVWDVRTGRTAMVLDGHVKEILAMDFAPSGYQIATGSGDDTVRIWDLRALKTQYMIPAHRSSVSDLKFFRSTSEMPFSPLDAPIPVTNGSSTPAPHASNGNGSMQEDDEDEDRKPDIKDEMPDIKPEIDAPLPKSGLFLVTAGFDCNVRIWSADEWAMIRNLPTDAGKVMSVDVSGDGKFIASASYSRSFHLFGGDHSL